MKKSMLQYVLVGHACMAWMLLAMGCFTGTIVDGGVNHQDLEEAGSEHNNNHAGAKTGKKGVRVQEEESLFDPPDKIEPTPEYVAKAQDLLDETFNNRYYIEPTNGTKNIKRLLVILPGLNSPSEIIFKEMGNGQYVFGDPKKSWGRDDVFVVIPSPTRRDCFWEFKDESGKGGAKLPISHAWFNVKPWDNPEKKNLPVDTSDVVNTKPLFKAFFTLLFQKLQKDYQVNLTYSDTHLMGISMGGATAIHLAIHGDMNFQRVTTVQGFYPPFSQDGSLLKVEKKANTSIPKINILYSPEDQLIISPLSKMLTTMVNTYGYGGKDKLNTVAMEGSNHVGLPPLDHPKGAPQLDPSKGQYYQVHSSILNSIRDCVEEWMHSYPTVKVGGKQRKK